MAERTKEHYEKSFKLANKFIATLAGEIVAGNYDNSRIADIRILKRTINEQRTDLAQNDFDYKKQNKCGEHPDYTHFVAKSKEVLDELTNIPVMQTDKTIEDIFRGDN